MSAYSPSSGDACPAGLRVFLLTLAIADDIGGIAIIAVFYTDDLSLPWLGGAVGLIALVLASQRLGIRHVPIYVVIGFILWYATFESGIHATIAGVILGLLTPANPFRGRDVMRGLEHTLLPYSSFRHSAPIRPRQRRRRGDARRARRRLQCAHRLGGHPRARCGKVRRCRRGHPRRPPPRRWPPPRRRHDWDISLGASLLAGIGFTVSLFIAELSFGDRTSAILDQAKIGVLAGSLVAGAAGAIFLYVVSPRIPHQRRARRP